MFVELLLLHPSLNCRSKPWVNYAKSQTSFSDLRYPILGGRAPALSAGLQIRRVREHLGERRRRALHGKGQAGEVKLLKEGLSWDSKLKAMG